MKPLLRRPARAGAPRRRQGGWLMIELAAVIALSSLLVLWQAPAQVRAVEDASMDTVGVYMQVLNGAVEKYSLANHDALGKGQPVAGFANPMAPTIEELIAAKFLSNPSFPRTITRQAIPVAVKMVVQNCPGTDCQIFGVSYGTQALTMGSANVRYDLVGRYLQAAGGSGAASHYNDPSNLRSAVFNLPNPNGAVGGTIAIGTYLDEGLYQRFVQIRDTRDPDLQGNLSAAGNLKIGGSSKFAGDVNVNDCIRLQPDGKGGFSCLDPNDLPAGYTGGVRSADVVASGNVLASDAPGAFTGNNGSYALLSNGGGGEAKVQTSGKVAGNRLIPTGAYTPGAGCTEAGALARSTDTAFGGVLVVCSGSQWSALSTIANAEAACPNNGAGAVDYSGRQLYCFKNVWKPMYSFLPPAQVGAGCSVAGAIGYEIGGPGISNSALVCRANPADPALSLRWARLQDVTSNLMFVTSLSVHHGDNIAKPSCPTTPLQTPPVAIAQMLGKVESSSDGGFARFAVDNGSYWTVQLTNGAGAALSAAPQANAVMEVYCYYP